jgi:hypothetical protein
MAENKKQVNGRVMSLVFVNKVLRLLCVWKSSSMMPAAPERGRAGDILPQSSPHRKLLLNLGVNCDLDLTNRAICSPNLY